LAQSLEDLVRQSGDLLKEVDWNDLLTAVGAIVEGTATVHVDPGESLADAVDELPAEGGEIALRAGTHELSDPLVIKGRTRISLTGAGASTVVRCATSEAALVLDGCTETTLSRLRVEGGTPAAKDAAHINGALTVLGGADLTLSECTLACPAAATPRAQSCLTVRTAAGGVQADRLRIDRCRFEIGAFQIGALIVDPATVTIERNHAFLRPGPANTAADAGILVVGANVGTVRILDNVIENAIRGIHVGVSRGTAAPAVAADVVLLSGNVIHVFVPTGYRRDRHAVFVGNARSISILDTAATLVRPILRDRLLTRFAPVEGIRVYGSFGPFLLVRGSSLRGFNVGVRIVPLAAPSIATWVVSDTLADGAAHGVDAPDTVEQERNRPAPLISKPGLPANVFLLPAVSTSAINAKQKLTATVTDVAGVRVPSATVRFSVSGANILGEVGVTTDQNGEAVFEYTGTKAGADTVHAYADVDRDGVQDIGEPFANASHNNVAPDPATLVLDKTSAASTTGTPVTIKATVRDAAAAPVANVDVHFTVTGANPKADSVVKSDATGVATFSYTGNNQGTDVVGVLVTSQAGERRATATITYLPPVPAKVVLSPPQGFAFKGAAVTFTATVLDAANLPRPGVTVRFKVTGANSTSSSAVSDAQGQAKLTYTGTNAGTDQITAFADINNNGVQEVTEPFATASETFTLKEADRILVPNLIGLTRTGAETALNQVGLALGKVTTETFESIRAITLFVRAQSPAAGALVNPGSAVNITVSSTIDEGPVESFFHISKPGPDA
jgi:hypothetical protein